MFSNLAPYDRTITHVGEHEISLTLSKSDSDFDGRWILNPESSPGDIHFHLNKRLDRIQAWIFRTCGWDEILITHLWRPFNEANAIRFIQGRMWVEAVESAKRKEIVGGRL